MSGGGNGERPTAEVVPLRPVGKCAICGRETVRAHYPFCSKRCRDVDLNRWLSGTYVIAAREDDEDAGDRGSGNGES